MEKQMTDTTTLGSDSTPKADDPASTPPAPLEGVVEPQQQPTEGVETPKASEPTEGEPAKPTEVKGAPTEYTFTPPEGQTLDESVMDAFKATAKDLNLTNDGAQSILDSVLPKMAEVAKEKLDAIRTEWRELAKKDEEIGGSAFETNLKTANQALDRFGNEEQRQLLKETGLGDHPAFIRPWFKVGKAISEDTFLSGGTPGRAEEDLSDPEVQARRMYPEK